MGPRKPKALLKELDIHIVRIHIIVHHLFKGTLRKWQTLILILSVIMIR